MALDEGDRSIIQLMIAKAINDYDSKQEVRHQQNLQKFDVIQETIGQIKNIRGLISWGLPTIISIALLVAEIIRVTHER